ncbi:MarR family transcriptional regulator [Luteimonas sp. BDR2-5]|uniref:MarR family winged helix-turn-helix transcriptional regulator n=1 Tax=Proluteimonas luteida TaxID=2878685 RepID=UPI001E3DFA1E|nr:MarR family transcriptional regulator [Luteimonas sp. BDR2-5]MCD9029152.1 MarR family transcriptional regulator [Luteimonas sp. BDR2-5]
MGTTSHVRVGTSLVRMLHRVEEAHGRAAGQANVHTTDFRCIAYLKAQDRPISPKQIAEYLGITSGACTALLDRMASAGFIRRLPNSQDRRSVLVVLDEKAAASQLAVLEKLHECYREAVLPFSDRDLEAIASYLDRITDLVTMEGDAGPAQVAPTIKR